jgi:hypothetical protein
LKEQVIEAHIILIDETMQSHNESKIVKRLQQSKFCLLYIYIPVAELLLLMIGEALVR